jgi:molecular chaperone HscB
MEAARKAMKYFEWFELPPGFFPDQGLVKKKYYALSRQYHPDFYVQQGDEALAAAEEKLQEIHEAYATLSNRQRTIAYILKETVGMPEDEKYALPADFLMDMMELNEALQEADTEEGKLSVREQIKAQQQALYEQVEPIMADYQASITSQEALLQVKQYYYQQKYLQRLLAAE